MMTRWTAPKSLFLSRILVKVVMLLCVAALFCIPICTEWYDAVSAQEPIAPLLNVCGYLCIGIGFLAVWQLDALLRRIHAQEIFVEKNVSALRIISWCCFGIAVVLLVLSFWRMLAFIVAFAAAFFGLIMRVLKNVFALAVELRQENDFTI